MNYIVSSHSQNGSFARGGTEANRKKLVLIDFDGTITSQDSLKEFIIYAKGRLNFYIGFLMLAPVLILYKLKIVSSDIAKEKLLTLYFGGMDEKIFQETCEAYVRDAISSIVREKAMAEIKKHLANEDRVVVVSASPEHWVGEWAKQTGVECVATRLEIKGGKITGKFLGRNCRGQEKVRRIKEYLDLSQYAFIYTYGDSVDDLPMLKLGSEMFYKPFAE